MGSWGLGTFDDDIACDWVEDLYDSDPLAFFVQCLDLTGLNELDYLACIGVVCTAESIHALLRQPREGLPEAVCRWAERHSDLDVMPLLPDVIAGLRRVMDRHSELHLRWEDNEEMYHRWMDQMYDLIRRLESILVEN